MKTKILFLLILLMIGGCAIFMTQQKATLFPSFDLNVPAPLPKSARILNGPYDTGLVGVPSREGLDLLRGAASGQFTEMSLLFMANRFSDPSSITVIDLREETHGFVNGMPISWKLPHTTWTNRGKTVEEIEADEVQFLQDVLKQGFVVLDPLTNPLKIEVGHVQTERQLVESHGMHYLRIPITENHPPTDEQVERMVKLIAELPEKGWVYGHCHGGRGRATLFSAMYDILKNSDKFTLEEILMRQLLLGGTDLMRLQPLSDVRYHAAIERMDFFKRFYAYVKADGPGNFPFSQWK